MGLKTKYFILMVMIKGIKSNVVDNNENTADSILQYSESSSDQSSKSDTSSTSNDYDYNFDFYDYDYPGSNVTEVIKKYKLKCEENGWELLKQNKRPILNACLERGYQANHPSIQDKVLRLYTTFNYQKVLKVDEHEQTLTTDIKESTFWEDKRIKTTFRNSNGHHQDQIDLKTNSLQIEYPIWTPPLPFRIDNLKEWISLYDPMFLSQLTLVSSNPITPNVTLVNASLQWRVTIFCEFEFSIFPLDVQQCPFHVRGSNSKRVKRLLYDTNNIYHSKTKYDAAGFEVEIQFIGNNYAENNETEYTDLFGFEITLKRLIGPYLFQYYMPCFAIVIVSFISFIVPLSAIPGRIALVVTQFLTLTNIFIHQMVCRNV